MLDFFEIKRLELNLIFLSLSLNPTCTYDTCLKCGCLAGELLKNSQVSSSIPHKGLYVPRL